MLCVEECKLQCLPYWRIKIFPVLQLPCTPQQINFAQIFLNVDVCWKIDMCSVLLRAPLHSRNSFGGGGGLRFSFWTKTSGDHWICRMFTRAYAFEKLYPESNPENSFYGCTTKKIICERLKLIVCDLGVKKSVQNHGIWVPLCGNGFIMRTTETSK